jgi:outer membrane receptor protein involved in Fe transport
VANGVTLRGSAYSGLRQPTINELYRTFTVFPVTTNANPLLGNERLKGVEGGVDLGPFAGSPCRPPASSTGWSMPSPMSPRA